MSSTPQPLYRLITHKFTVTRGTPLHPVKTRGTDLTPVCPSHHNHTRENLPGAPPHTLPIRYLPKVYKYERYITLYCTAPLPHAVDLKPRGCRKLKRGATRTHAVIPSYICYVYEPIVRFAACCSVAVAMPVHCTAAFEINRECGLKSSRYVQDAHKHAQTRTRKWNTVRACHRGDTSKCGCCRTMAATTCTELGGRGDTYTAAADSTAKTKC